MHPIYCSLFKTIGIMATPKAPQEQGINDSVPREKRSLNDADDEQHIAKKSRDHVDFHKLCWNQDYRFFELKKTTGKIEIGSYWCDESGTWWDENTNVSAILFKEKHSVLHLMFRKDEELYFKNIFTNKVKRCLVNELDELSIRHIPFKYYRLLEIEAKSSGKRNERVACKCYDGSSVLFSKRNVCLLESDVDGRMGWIDQAKCV